jgi:glycine dehydrogenase subunit 2
MTVYFPLVVHGAMLVEPTETESKAGLDQFITAMESLGERARAGDPRSRARRISPAPPRGRNPRRAQAALVWSAQAD